ncbi:protein of unknown function UPF0153 [Desulfofarcimen acetoxidans DSM 771]|uniref:YkgJ family cysteine cluster protein n=1 Tax=Desulfofarcimen acetoxidans (strain ATCC 49208 / DSM 771 / KCTC 5769 / VKM B-1644 / 5575) TaxID=485916 RepID=C8VX89_DESAS|nr:YkgJ family cysteine cluster protein [Desulfofarcimen acetoxidans]ACV64485.1 protein of unknown function UPF0153 [Desulfofarcimen acetoxidans DSM 771]
MKEEIILNLESKFNFSCHQGLECFKQCCRNINIFLSPYDVLRMKNKLGLTSQEFLNLHTLRLSFQKQRFPLVLIKMKEDENLVCPFITSYGCMVYQERPWACRIAPVDMLGNGQFGFIFKPARCHGLKEAKEQTVDEWMQEQGLGIYDQMEESFKDLPALIEFSGEKEHDGKIGELIFLVCYNTDEFKYKLFSLSFVDKLSISKEVVGKIRDDDVQLMKFGFEWLRSVLSDMQKQREAFLLL